MSKLFRIHFTMDGMIEIDAKDKETAYELFRDMSYEEMACSVAESDVTEVEETDVCGEEDDC